MKRKPKTLESLILANFMKARETHPHYSESEQMLLGLHLTVMGYVKNLTERIKKLEAQAKRKRT